MIYSVDTCALLDILLPDPVHGVLSKEVLKKAAKDGKLVVCPIVYSELSPQFETQVSLDTFLKETGIEVLPFTRDMLWKGGNMNAWLSIREAKLEMLAEEHSCDVHGEVTPCIRVEVEDYGRVIHILSFCPQCDRATWVLIK